MIIYPTNIIIFFASERPVLGLLFGKVEIDAGSSWLGKSVVIMIKRGDECIIPSGQTILQSGDQLVILDIDN